jgi:Xaa-Pro aminopeptidase
MEEFKMDSDPYPVDLQELEIKQKRLLDLMQKHELDAMLITRLSNFFWFTGGRDCSIFFSLERGEASLWITPQHKALIVPNVEAARLAEEEGLADQGYEFLVQPWWQPGRELARLSQGKRWGADWPLPGAQDLSDQVARLRWPLTAVEMDRFRWLGQASARALESTAFKTQPGMSETQLAGLLAQEALSRSVTPTLALVGSDERVSKYRHPIPTQKLLKRYAMLVICGRRWGLVASATRLVHFGPMPEELERKLQAVARVDATYIQATQPGALVSVIFQRAAEAYAQVGYPDEWQKHYQGGAAGYESREYESTPDSEEIVQRDVAYAWNPSITGVKSEDTFLLTHQGREFITVTEAWPQIEVTLQEETIPRPDILRRS